MLAGVTTRRQCSGEIVLASSATCGHRKAKGGVFSRGGGGSTRQRLCL